MSEEYNLDSLDRKILTELQNNGRKSFRKIAEEVDSTAVTVINRVEKMEDNNVIDGYSVDINFAEIGYKAVAAIEIVAQGQNLPEVEEMLSNHPNITAVYKITGNTDILIVAKFKKREDLSSFVVDELLDRDEIEKTITHVAFEDYMENLNLDLMQVEKEK
ncbi:MAG: Lrp/AsnC family transcriptional regulator [Candidatus Nanohaloarchaeota archaeon QJJ-9]|nr:Lrp/AsnC family transcriptional regulator [Candidatus Nanohaloarchaeota archaeon QJJ-9]